MCPVCGQWFGQGMACQHCGAAANSAAGARASSRGRAHAALIGALVLALVLAGAVIWRVAAPSSTGGVATPAIPDLHGTGSGVRPGLPTTAPSTTAPSTTASSVPQSSIPQSSMPQPQPTGGPDGELRIGVPLLPHTSDPATSFGNQSMWKAVFETLTTYTGTSLQPSPELATSWEMSADAKTWAFEIASGHTFHDGEPVTAQAVCDNFAFWIQLGKDSEKAVDFYDWNYYFGPRGQAPMASCAASGELATITMSVPAPHLADLLTLAAFSIHSPSSLGSTDVIGSGPYRWVSGDDSNVSVRVADGESDVRTALLTFTAISDQSALREAVLGGDLDIVQVGDVGGEDVPSGLRAYPVIADSQLVLGLQAGAGPLADSKIRSGVLQAIDRTKLAAVLSGELATSSAPPALGGGRIEFPPLNPAAARNALAGKGITLRLGIRDYRPGRTDQLLATVLTEALKDAGVTVTRQHFSDVSAMIDAIDGQLIDLSFFDALALTADPMELLDVYYSPTKGPYRYLVPQGDNDLVDANIEDAVLQTTQSARVQAALFVTDDLVATGSILPIINKGSLWITSGDVTGFAVGPFDLIDWRAAATG